MKHKILAVSGIIALTVGLLAVIPAGASGPKPPAGLIAVDIDPYYKSLTDETASAKIQADTMAAAPELAEAAASHEASGGSALGVGDVRPFYADGWRDFTLQAIGDNAEIWVANDLSYCPGDPRPPDVVTQDQIDHLFAEFNGTIYPSA